MGLMDWFDRLLNWINRKVDAHPLGSVILVAVLVTGPAYLRQERTIDDVEDAVHLIQEQRTEARRSTCLNDRRFALGHNGLVLYLTHIPGRPPPDSAVAEAFEKANLVPVRECTPEAIEDFYEAEARVTTPTTTEPVPFKDDG